jgi:Co/Zn/Cd efflux system component
MFLAEMIAGHLAKSQALEADALDFLADTACCSRAPLAGSGWPARRHHRGLRHRQVVV